MEAKKAYAELVSELGEILVLSKTASALSWDQETYMPHGATPWRSRQMATLSRLIHEKSTSKKMGDLLAACEAGGLGKGKTDVAVNVRHTRVDYDRATKLPGSLVEEQAKTRVLAHAEWAKARKAKDFSIFAPWLKKTVELKQQEAKCYGYTTEPWDALCEDYEPGETAAGLAVVLEDLRGKLVPLIAKVMESGRTAPLHVLEKPYAIPAQEAFGKGVIKDFGFDFEQGRLDVTVHPFCTDLGPGDVRLTTRYDANNFGDAFFSILHEAGHGLYQQGLLAKHAGTPMGSPVSLGIHESQSRMWENLVGRSPAFWKHYFPKAKKAFGSTLSGVSAGDFLWAINDIRPSFIRVDSDEATYNLHIMVRFEMERAILRGDMSIKDIPAAWNEKVKAYLGLKVPDDSQGCLQDVHWSYGAMGYFPTYTLGNLYAAQFFEKADADLGGLEAKFAKGEFAPLLKWLRENIHVHGKKYGARELVKRVTGKDLSADALVRHLSSKIKRYYKV